MKTFIACTSLGLTLLLGACQQPVETPPKADEAVDSETASTGWKSMLGGHVVTDEAARIAQFPDLVRRDGDTLTILYDGKPVFSAKSTPQSCLGDATCDVWQFDSGIRLLNVATGKLETYAQLYHSEGEGGETVIIQRDGKPFYLYTPGIASPDGKWIAFGDSWVDEYIDGNVLGVADWAGKTPAVYFSPSCKPVAWQDNSTFTTDCAVIGQDVYRSFDGKVTRSTGGSWLLTVTKTKPDKPYGESSASSVPQAPLPKTYDSKPKA